MSEREHISREALAALNHATLAITSHLALDKVLRQITESARQLVGARYAALGVPNRQGVLVEFVHSGMEPGLVNTIGRLPQGLGLLGAILHDGHGIRIADITRDPRSVGFPRNHPPMHSFLGVPIRVGDEVLGNLYLTEKIGAAEFSQADQELIELLAAHAALAIQNARLYEQVGRMAVVEERSRIGMDLHDGVIQAVYAVGLTLESTRLLLPEEEAEAIGLIGRAIDGLNEAIGDIRNFILDLRPRRFEGNLHQGLARLAREFQANTMVPVTMLVPEETTQSISPAVARSIFLTAQEAMANVARHARANSVVMDVERTDEFITLTVRDDGIGFDPTNQHLMMGHGLANMRVRAEERNGSFKIVSRPGEGTAIHLMLPLNN